MLGLYFLNISINFYSFFGIQIQTVSTVKTSEGSSFLSQAGFDTGSATGNNGTNTSNNAPAEEEEEEKAAHDDFYTIYFSFYKHADETYSQRFHGIHATREFISEIVPPPPKA